MKRTIYLLFVLLCFFPTCGYTALQVRKSTKSKSAEDSPSPFVYVPEPSFEWPVSQLATESQFYSKDFVAWAKAIKEPVKLHRKLWEFCFVAQVLSQQGVLQPGKKGLGFGVGCEPLPALFASYGCEILASDQDFDAALQQGWVDSGQFAKGKEKLNSNKICDPDLFNQLVKLRSVDMNNIDPDLRDYDFVWSCCSLEHLGSLEAGLAFIINSIDCLKKGGIAVHTTEYNISSNTDTFESPTLSIYRAQDILALVQRLTDLGYTVAPLNFNKGSGKLDDFVDLPPYKLDPHIKLLLENYVCTSIGIIVVK